MRIFAMTSPYDCRRATEDEMQKNHDLLEWAITLNDKAIMFVRSLEYASAMVTILNQEASIWQKDIDALKAQILLLENQLASRN
jgi:hypothetical protein